MNKTEITLLTISAFMLMYAIYSFAYTLSSQGLLFMSITIFITSFNINDKNRSLTIIVWSSMLTIGALIVRKIEETQELISTLSTVIPI